MEEQKQSTPQELVLQDYSTETLSLKVKLKAYQLKCVEQEDVIKGQQEEIKELKSNEEGE